MFNSFIVISERFIKHFFKFIDKRSISSINQSFLLYPLLEELGY